MIHWVTSAYLEVLKFLEGLGPRHTTPTVKSVSFNNILSSLFISFRYLSHFWVLQIVMSQVKPLQNDHHNYLLHFHFLLEPIIFSCFKHVSFSYIIIGAFFNWNMRYKNPYLVSDSVWQIFCNI